MHQQRCKLSRTRLRVYFGFESADALQSEWPGYPAWKGAADGRPSHCGTQIRRRRSLTHVAESETNPWCFGTVRREEKPYGDGVETALKLRTSDVTLYRFAPYVHHVPYLTRVRAEEERRLAGREPERIHGKDNSQRVKRSHAHVIPGPLGGALNCWYRG